MKVYAALNGESDIRWDLQDAPMALLSRLPQPARASGRHGVGFLCLRQARPGPHALLAWWADESELWHRGYICGPSHLEPLAPSQALPGWARPIVSFERRAWAGAVVDGAAGPDLNAYLRSVPGARE
jgi:hypothetical protein